MGQVYWGKTKKTEGGVSVSPLKNSEGTRHQKKQTHKVRLGSHKKGWEQRGSKRPKKSGGANSEFKSLKRKTTLKGGKGGEKKRIHSSKEKVYARNVKR